MTDGWNRPRPGEPEASTPASPGRPTAPSPWWSDALKDPWRDPEAPAAIVLPAVRSAPPVDPPAKPEPPSTPLRPGRLFAVVLLTAALVGTLAGALGGALGYTYARHSGVGTALGDPGRAPAAQPQPGSLAQVVERVLPSVVTVRSASLGGSTLGSGFIISTAGHVLTNDHVVGEASGATVTFHDGSSAPATLVGRDPESDIAVLRVAATHAPPVQFGDSESVRVGDTVLAIGSPLALANTVTSGIVSAVDRAVQAGDPGGQVRYYAAIQTDAAVNQGNSGGPLVDAAGRVIGINSVIKSVSMSETEAANIGLAFAIPISHGKRVAQEIIDTGRARRTVIGAELERTARSGGDGVRLMSVADGGPAAQAGLRAGDVLVSLDGRPVQQPLDVIALVRKHAPGTVVRVEYRRGGTTESVAVTLAAAD